MQHKEEEQVFQQLISGTQGELQQRHNSNHIPKIRFPGEFVLFSFQTPELQKWTLADQVSAN